MIDWLIHARRLRHLNLAGLVVALAASIGAFPAQAYVTFLGQWGGSGTGFGQFGQGGISALATGPDGTVYAVDPSNERVEMFTRDGAPIGSFGSADNTNGNSPAPGAFDQPVGVATDAQAGVYVLDWARNPSVQRFDSRGRFESQFPPDTSRCYVGCSQPTAIAVAANGDVLVLQGAGAQVQRFNPAGQLLQTWGSPGTGPGQFECAAPVSYCVGGPSGIAVGPDGSVYVADTYNDRVEVFSGSGAFERQWSVPADERGDGLQPKSIAIGPDSEVYVSGDSWSSVDAFSATGHLDYHFGHTAFTGCPDPDSSCVMGGNGGRPVRERPSGRKRRSGLRGGIGPRVVSLATFDRALPARRRAAASGERSSNLIRPPQRRWAREAARAARRSRGASRRRADRRVDEASRG